MRPALHLFSASALLFLPVTTACGNAARNEGGGTDAPIPGTVDAAPDAAEEIEPPGPHFFVHLSDIHIDSGSFAAPALDYVLDTVLPSFEGVPVLVTGDLVEAGHRLESWQTYVEKTTQAGLSADNYVECAGNHDSLLDGELANYLRFSVAGRAGRGLHEIYNFERYGESVRVITTNTADAGDPVRDGAGYIKRGQVDAILAEVAALPSTPIATLVLGHHPKDSPDGLELLGTDENMERLLDGVHATAYVFGHSHVHANYWDGSILHTMAATSGNPGDDLLDWVDPGFSLLAIDQGPSEISVPILGVPPEALHSPWPALMITRPAARDFGVVPLSGNTNPVAKKLPRATGNQMLNAGAFAPMAIGGVYYRVDNGPELPMKDMNGYYRAYFTTPDADECTITVRAEAGGVSQTQTIAIDLE